MGQVLRQPDDFHQKRPFGEAGRREQAIKMSSPTWAKIRSQILGEVVPIESGRSLEQTGIVSRRSEDLSPRPMLEQGLEASG